MAGANSTCADIQANINNNLVRLQTLQRQKAGTKNRAVIAQIQQQISELQQEVAALKQEAEELNCP